MNMNRRSILGALGISPIAGPAIAGTLSQGHAMPPSSFAPATESFEWAAQGASVPPSIDGKDALLRAYKLGIVSRKQLIKLINYEYNGNVHRIDGFDPDISSAKSWSKSAKARMQTERDREQRVNDFLNTDPKNLWDYGRALVEKGLISPDERAA